MSALLTAATIWWGCVLRAYVCVYIFKLQELYNLNMAGYCMSIISHKAVLESL